jgi:hypothetical protein
MPNPAPWLIEDDYDRAPAEALLDNDLGRFACNLCADNRDAAERTAAALKRANALLSWFIPGSRFGPFA